MQQDWPILILTLPGDEVRRQPLLDALAEMGLSWRLMFGVDGRNGLPSEYEAMVDRDRCAQKMRRAISDPELACALTHRAAYQEIVSSGVEAALILEDDALVQPGLKDFIAAGGMTARPMILLDYGRIPVSRVSGRNFGQFGRLWRVVGSAPFTTGYIVSRDAARYLLDVTSPVQSVADWPGSLYDARAYALSPRLVHHLPVDNHLSHIAPGRSKNLLHESKKSRWRYFTKSYWRGYLRLRLAWRLDP